MRDPRTDPIAGDVVIATGQSRAREVVEVDHRLGIIYWRYRDGYGQNSCSLRTWRRALGPDWLVRA